MFIRRNDKCRDFLTQKDAVSQAYIISEHQYNSPWNIAADFNIEMSFSVGQIGEMLYKGRKVSFSPAEKSINLGIMFGLLKEKDGYVAISNRIFEMYLLNLFIAEESIKSEIFFYGQRMKLDKDKN